MCLRFCRTISMRRGLCLSADASGDFTQKARRVSDLKGLLISASLAFDDLERWGEILALSNFDLILGGIIGEDCLRHHQVEIGDEVIECIAAVTD